jgi:hypothetical protein
MGRRKEPLRRERGISRTIGKRSPRSRFLICCEGSVTEPGYFKFIRSELRDALIEIKIVKNVGDPLQLVDHVVGCRADAVREARRARDDNLLFEQVWCVVDVDTHERLPLARERSRDAGIGLAVPNPCFEIWPLLHFVDQRRSCDPQQAQQLLTREIPGYRKDLDCTGLRGKYDLARGRATRLQGVHEATGASCSANPSTEVWKVVDALLRAARESRGSISDLRL